MYQRLFQEVQSVYGNDSAMAGLVLFRIGFLYAKQGNFEKALPDLERSLKLISPLPDEEQNLVTKANLYWGLGMAYKALLMPDEAIHAFEQCVRLREKVPGVDDPSLIQILISIADLHSEHHHHPLKAVPLLERALLLSENKFGTNSAEAATVLASLGNTREQAGQFEPALASLKRSLEIREKVLPPTSPEIGISLHNLGSLFGRRGDYRQALQLLDKGVRSLEKNYTPSDAQSAFRLAGALNSLGMVQIESGNYAEGVAALERSLGVNESAFGSASINLVSTLNTMAVAYHRQGDFQRAAPLLERALRIVERAPPEKTPQLADTLNNLAELLRAAGNEGDAARLFKRSSEIAEARFGPDHISLAYSLNGLALIHQNRGDFSAALACFERSLATLEKNLGDSHAAVAGVLNNIACLCEAKGDTSGAMASLRRALAIQQRVLPANHPATATTLNNLAVLLRKGGQLTETRELHRRSLAITDAALGKDSPESCSRLENLGILDILGGDPTKGLGEFVESSRRWRRYLAGQMSSGQGQAAARAQESFRTSCDWFHSLCAAVVARQSRTAAAAGAEQWATSKGLHEEVEAIGARLATDGRGRVRELRGEAANKRRRLEALAAPVAPSAWASERDGWRSSERDRLEQELAVLQARIGAVSDSVASVIRERDLSLADIARSLPQDSVLVDVIQYRRTDFTPGSGQWKEQRYAAYVTFPLAKGSTDPVVERVDLGEAAPINQAVELICGRLSAGRGYATPDLHAALGCAGELVYARVAKHLANVPHLIICPDGQLSRLPFEMLVHEGRFLIEDKTISYVGSGREIVRLAGGPKSKVQLSKSLVMGNPDCDLDLSSAGAVGDLARKSETNANLRKPSGAVLASTLRRDYRGKKFPPLPWAEAEARSVAKLLGADAVLKVGADAREAALKAVVSPRVLHLATHGIFLPDQEFRRTNGIYDGFLADGSLAPWRNPPGEDWENPMVRCGIALAGANHASEVTNPAAEDGLLTGLEASLLNLQGTELVILSACDSGAGEVRIGEGVMSLRRAFRIAGAQTVLASHWRVSDKATGLLMTEFMRRWRSGEPRAEAWREAQLSLLHSKEFSNPYFWACFTLTGQWK